MPVALSPRVVLQLSNNSQSISFLDVIFIIGSALIEQNYDHIGDGF